MSGDEGRAYNAGAAKIVQDLLDGKVDWDGAVGMQHELDELFGRRWEGNIRFTGEREQDRQAAQQELNWRRKRDVARLGMNRNRVEA